MTVEPEMDGGWGFMFPERVVQLGYAEWSKTGVIPDPYRIMALPSMWVDDLARAHQIVKHKEPPKENKPGPK